MTLTRFRHAGFMRPVAIALVSLLVMPTMVGASDVIPPVPPPPRPAIVGFVDTHLHQFANLGFGGLEVWGSPMDPTGDATALLETARARALPNSDFVYVSSAQAANYLAPGGDPVTDTSSAESCADGSCWAQCPPGTGVPGNACWRITIHGPGGSADILNGLVPNGSAGHGVIGYPDMNGWPAWDVLTTQQAYWEWLTRAHQHGLKLMVMLAVNNSVLCQVAIHLNSFGCSDDPSVDRQIQGAKDLETYIDARAGGSGQGFYRIVYSSAEAREAIADGKLAVVLGTEVDSAWGCTTGAASCTAAHVEAQVQNYYDQGIRVVYPVHLIDNKFGGAAVYNGLFEVNNWIVNGDWFNMAACGAPIEWRSDIRQFAADAEPAVIAGIAAIFFLGPLALPLIEIAVAILKSQVPLIEMLVPVLQALLPGIAPILDIGGTGLVAVAAGLILSVPDPAGSAPDGNCNSRGLTAVGQALVSSLMAHQMIIDVDHTDGPTFDAILSMAEAAHYPGIVAGHAGLVGSALTAAEVTGLGFEFKASDSGRNEGSRTNAQVQRIINAGGFVSLGLNAGSRSTRRNYSSSDSVAFDCGKSSQAFAQAYLYATQQLGLTAVGFGSDINGFAGSPAPRYGSKACAGDHAGSYDAFGSAGRLNYATATDYFGQPLSQYSFGNQTWDYNTDGFAHAGLYPDFVADLRAVNLTHAQLAPLFNGAEAYVRMWEKVDDHDAPTVRCGTVGEDWHAADVVVPCLAFDIGWGLEHAADASFSLATSVANGTETGNASTGTHAAICDSDDQCTGVVPAITGINVDKKDPTVTVATPAAGTPTYLLNQVVLGNYGCTDGGSGVGSCAGPLPSGAALDTTLGTHAFTVTGVDNVGHTVSVAHPYNVTFKVCVQYDQDKAHRAGSAVPIKLALCDVNDVNVSASSIVVTATAVTKVSTSAPGVLEDAGHANPDDMFRFVGGSYVFNLKTTGFQTGTYALTFTATGDPLPHDVYFQIR